MLDSDTILMWNFNVLNLTVFFIFINIKYQSESALAGIKQGRAQKSCYLQKYFKVLVLFFLRCIFESCFFPPHCFSAEICGTDCQNQTCPLLVLNGRQRDRHRGTSQKWWVCFQTLLCCNPLVCNTIMSKKRLKQCEDGHDVTQKHKVSKWRVERKVSKWCVEKWH